MSNVKIEERLEMRRIVADELDAIHAMDIDVECKTTLNTIVFVVNYLDEMGLLSKTFPASMKEIKEHYFSFSHKDTFDRMQMEGKNAYCKNETAKN